jgi:hypothetical protein
VDLFGDALQKCYTSYITYTNALPGFFSKCYTSYIDALPGFFSKCYTSYITYTMPISLTLSPTPALHVSQCRCCTVPLSGDIVSVSIGWKGVFAPPGMYIRRMVRFLKSFCEILFWGMNVLEFMRHAALSRR